jgi:tRNA pseudouridine32 synthase/23S rRNA pseudouridine746 synthase
MAMRMRTAASASGGGRLHPAGPPPDRLVFKGEFISQEATTACDFLASRTGLSKRAVKEVMTKGGVWLQRRSGARPGQSRRLRRSTTALRSGDRLEIYYDRSVLAREPPAAQLLHRNPHYGVWFKPAGLLSCGTRFGDHCSLLRQVQRWRGPSHEVFLVHRLDREASGLMLVAHTQRAAARLSSLFSTGQIVKRYRAEVRGNMLASLGAEGRITLPLDGKEAITRFQVESYDPRADMTTLQAVIETGRLHQIRRHLALVGHAVLGDPRYGRDNKNPDGMRLIATGLRFRCPFRDSEFAFELDLNSSQLGLRNPGGGRHVL